jgi:hypothetical protein
MISSTANCNGLSMRSARVLIESDFVRKIELVMLPE